ncbi:MAG: hypothetical protein ABSE56_22750 [Bryobacteraceae bacterium]|jgi:hypothetical protein
MDFRFGTQVAVSIHPIDSAGAPFYFLFFIIMLYFFTMKYRKTRKCLIPSDSLYTPPCPSFPRFVRLPAAALYPAGKGSVAIRHTMLPINRPPVFTSRCRRLVSKQQITADNASVLAAADEFVRSLGALPLLVLVSAQASPSGFTLGNHIDGIRRRKSTMDSFVVARCFRAQQGSTGFNRPPVSA